VPRLRPGIPATLATIPLAGGPFSNQELRPFPSWEWQKGFEDSCRTLVSVFRSRLDPCGRLWVLDTGSVNPLGKRFEQVCPPKLVVFDPDGTEVFRVIIPQQLLRPDSLLVSLALDKRGPGRLLTCAQSNQMVVYISDVTSGMIVFDMQSNAFWRWEHPSMAPNKSSAHFNIQG
jgi:hypothetical protein